MKCFLKSLTAMTLVLSSSLFADNQTATLSSIKDGDKLPFKVKIKLENFFLPNGIQAGASAIHDGKWLFLAGRTNGLHGFNDDNNNFPPQLQNTVVYVVDPKKKKVYSRSLLDPQSGLTTAQIDSLSVTSPQFYRNKNTLYITGGYNYNTATAQFTTKDTLTAIDIEGLMHWVMHPSHHDIAVNHIRQISNSLFQVTGGNMMQVGKHPTLLVFGQSFSGAYTEPEHDFIQVYTNQVRRFHIHDNGKKLKVDIKSSKPEAGDLNYRRRDLNVVPIIEKKHGKLKESFVALSGVFTPTDGIWTVPVEITAHGSPSMANPNKSSTFKQGMNNYATANFGMYSKKTGDMYTILLGGISFGYFQDGQFQTDSEIPFINQVTTVRIDKHGKYKQYLMSKEYPKILSTQSNPGYRLLFGSGSFFMPAENMHSYDEGLFKYDSLKKSQTVGYIVGGIQSTLPNTNTMSDSAASPYIFKVIVERD